MGVKMKTYFIAVVLMAFLCSFVTAALTQKKDPIEELNNRVNILEGQKENLDKQAELLKEKFENEVVSLNNKFIEQKRKLEDDYNYLTVLLWVFGLLTVIGIFTMAISMLISYFKIRKKIEGIAEEKIQKKFDSFFQEKKDQLDELINKQNEEFQLKKEKRILVLTPDGPDNLFLNKFFKGERFDKDKVKFDTPLNAANLNLNDFHVVLLDNEDDKFGKGLIPGIVIGSKEVVFVYFGPPNDESKAIQKEKNVAFANYRAQLYGNLINAMRYQKYL
jgi:hypothetical protein